MNSRIFPGIAAAAALCAGAASAQTGTNFTLVVNQAIPDGSPFGLTLTNDLTGLPGTISDLTVSLDIANGFNGDLYGYLAGPDTGFAVLLNRVGVGSANSFGYSDAGLNVTLDDAAANGDIHAYQLTLGAPPVGPLTGIWAPDGRNLDPQSTPSVFDSAARDATLLSFDNANPNGTWTLFLADLSPGGQSTLVSWGLDITTVPEPSTWALLILSLGTLAAARRRHFLTQ